MGCGLRFGQAPVFFSARGFSALKRRKYVLFGLGRDMEDYLIINDDFFVLLRRLA
jgi:hypothetical protein